MAVSRSSYPSFTWNMWIFFSSRRMVNPRFTDVMPSRSAALTGPLSSIRSIYGICSRTQDIMPRPVLAQAMVPAARRNRTPLMRRFLRLTDGQLSRQNLTALRRIFLRRRIRLLMYSNQSPSPSVHELIIILYRVLFKIHLLVFTQMDPLQPSLA